MQFSFMKWVCSHFGHSETPELKQGGHRVPWSGKCSPQKVEGTKKPNLLTCSLPPSTPFLLGSQKQIAPQVTSFSSFKTTSLLQGEFLQNIEQKLMLVLLFEQEVSLEAPVIWEHLWLLRYAPPECGSHSVPGGMQGLTQVLESRSALPTFYLKDR